MRSFCQFLFHFLSSVHAERRGSSMDASQVVGEGNASVTLTKLKLLDEGTYICTVSIGIVHAQQVIQLQVVRKFDPNLKIPINPLICLFISCSASLCFRTTSCFTLRGETVPDAELPLRHILSTGSSGVFPSTLKCTYFYETNL